MNAECIRFDPRGDDICVGVDCTSGDREVVGSHVLLAVGRRPNTDDLGLDKAGVEIDEQRLYRCRRPVAHRMFPASGRWATATASGAFTHTSYNDFEIVAANLLDNDPRRVSDRITAYALYIDPPLGRVGLSEAEARKSGRKRIWSASGR